jgi:hypothetical protein
MRPSPNAWKGCWSISREPSGARADAFHRASMQPRAHRHRLRAALRPRSSQDIMSLIRSGCSSGSIVEPCVCFAQSRRCMLPSVSDGCGAWDLTPLLPLTPPGGKRFLVGHAQRLEGWQRSRQLAAERARSVGASSGGMGAHEEIAVDVGAWRLSTGTRTKRVWLKDWILGAYWHFTATRVGEHANPNQGPPAPGGWGARDNSESRSN